MDKRELRRYLLSTRQQLTEQQWRDRSSALCQQLAASPVYRQAKTILAYFSFRREPDLRELISAGDRRWGFPRCVGKSLHWHYWQPDEPLQEGTYGILEPRDTAPVCQPFEVDLILVPAVACDPLGYRLGYGGGYYDRLFSQREWHVPATVGIVFENAIVPQVPIDPWDRPLKGVCTDKRWLEIDRRSSTFTDEADKRD